MNLSKEELKGIYGGCAIFKRIKVLFRIVRKVFNFYAPVRRFY